MLDLKTFSKKNVIFLQCSLMARFTGLALLSMLIALAVIGVFMWLYIEQMLFLFNEQNFSPQGENDWRRVLTLAFIFLAFFGLIVLAGTTLLGGFGTLAVWNY